jgi:hypothetical protein
VSSYIQIRTVDGRTLYTDWENTTEWAKKHPEPAKERRLIDFQKHLYMGKPFMARRSFIRDAAPVYECVVPLSGVASLSVISSDWENVLDEGQMPVYLYEDEIRALINGTVAGLNYTPPALESAIATLTECLDEQDEGWH